VCLLLRLGRGRGISARRGGRGGWRGGGFEVLGGVMGSRRVSDGGRAIGGRSRDGGSRFVGRGGR
jgi:hypothetical protein